MTLVFHEPHKPGVHALIIGVEDAPGPFSCAASATTVADWLQTFETAGTKLASIDLLVHSSSHPSVFYRRGRVSHPLDPPAAGFVREAVLGWRERLRGESHNVAFFYFAGPTLDHEHGTYLIGSERIHAGQVPNLIDLDNLWRGMADLPLRQLFFIESYPTERGAVELRAEPLLPVAGPAPERGARARYHGRVPAVAGPGQHTPPLSEALREALERDGMINSVELGSRLGTLFDQRMRDLGLTSFEPLEPLYEELFSLPSLFANWGRVLRAGEWSDRILKASDPAPDGPAGAAEDRAEETPEEEAAASRAVTGDEEKQRAAEARARVAPGEGFEKKAEPAELAAKRRAARQREQAGRVARLSEGQRACLRMVYRHMETKEIASTLGISPDGVAQRIKSAMRILGVHRRRDAALILAEVEGTAPGSGSNDLPQDRAVGGETLAAALRARGTGGRGAAARTAAEQEVASEAQPVPSKAPPAPEANTHFVSDDPEVERDELKRGPLAIALGRRLHRIWCRSNGITVPGDNQLEAGGDERSAFVLHLDAPWGGGKTSFANFLGRVLNPFPRGGTEAAKFLVERAGGAVGTIFIDDPPADGKEGGTAAKWPEDARRPWIVVPFNAWQAEHCSPPWWTFYQAIRKGCFAAVWAEGRSAARPAQASAPPRPLVEERIWSWAALWRRELWWRLRTPKVVARLATFAVAALVLLILWRTNVIFRGDEGPDFNAGNALGFLLAGIGGISGLWGIGALLTESVAPGTDDLAERRSLGGGDPFERFRRHFHRTIKAVRRPVMVIIDDLDRCRPDFVVDLVRGIQTLLRSPRVVFVILGDRDWIERAFEAHHAAMSKVNVGPEQDFGARFVEKAIQMSFILPEMPEPSQDSYVRRVLIGPGASAATPDAPAPAPIAQQLRADYREKVASAPTPEARKQAEDALVEQYRPQLEAAAKAGAADAATSAGTTESEAKTPSDVADAQAGKVLSEERALLAAVDERMGQALLHRLEPLARFFPANPRQIKRIVNAITMYTAVAYLQMEMDESDERGIELAIWVIIMTEWPKTWRVLASCPELADVLAEADPKAALDKIDETALPGSRASTLKEINRIRADPDLLALITEASDGRPRLRTSSVEEFVRLTPLYSRKQRLAEEAAPAEAAATGKG